MKMSKIYFAFFRFFSFFYLLFSHSYFRFHQNFITVTLWFTHISLISPTGPASIFSSLTLFHFRISLYEWNKHTFNCPVIELDISIYYIMVRQHENIYKWNILDCIPLQNCRYQPTRTDNIISWTWSTWKYG